MDDHTKDSKKNPSYTSFKWLVTLKFLAPKITYIFVSKPHLQTWIWDCTRSEAINNKPLGLINISSQSITGVKTVFGCIFTIVNLFSENNLKKWTICVLDSSPLTFHPFNDSQKKREENTSFAK